MAMKRLRLRLLIPILLVSATALYGMTRAGGGGSGLPPLNTVVVDEGDVAQRIVAHGTLQPRHRVHVGSQVSGIVQSIFVDFNARVERGQVIALIDPSTFEAAVRSARAELAAAEATLEMARQNWQRVQELHAHRIVSVSDLEQSQTQLRQAESQLSVRLHALERAERELERCTIRSPTDGIVISRSVDVGQTVAASLSAPVLFEIASDLGEMQIHANVSEADIGMIREGHRVRFAVDAHRGRTFDGMVVQVRNSPSVMDNVVHYEAVIAVANDEGLLKPGMTAEVSIITAEVAGAVRVRNGALRARLPDAIRPPDPTPADGMNGRVYRLEGGRIVPVPVRTGLSDGVNTEIHAGVSPGDTLVVGLSLAAEDNAGGRSLFRGNQAQF
jgi:HlyD family secretion protein